jgi:hypothetical protein
MQIDSRLTPSTLILSFLSLNLEVHCIAASLQHFDWHSINTTDNSSGFSLPTSRPVPDGRGVFNHGLSLVEPWTGFLTWRLLLGDSSNFVAVVDDMDLQANEL